MRREFPYPQACTGRVSAMETLDRSVPTGWKAAITTELLCGHPLRVQL